MAIPVPGPIRPNQVTVNRKGARADVHKRVQSNASTEWLIQKDKVKALIKKGADPRKALRGKYWGWILALARKREADERRAKGKELFDLSQDPYAQFFSFAPDPEPSIALMMSILRPSSAQQRDDEVSINLSL